VGTRAGNRSPRVINDFPEKNTTPNPISHKKDNRKIDNLVQNLRLDVPLPSRTFLVLRTTITGQIIRKMKGYYDFAGSSP
jgi:hypothetical protein